MEQATRVAAPPRPGPGRRETHDSKDIFAVLKLKAEWMDPTTLKGLQAALVERAAVEIENSPISTTEDIERVVDVLDKFDVIIHRHRGEAIGANGEAGSPISL